MGNVISLRVLFVGRCYTLEDANRRRVLVGGRHVLHSSIPNVFGLVILVSFSRAKLPSFLWVRAQGPRLDKHTSGKTFLGIPSPWCITVHGWRRYSFGAQLWIMPGVPFLDRFHRFHALQAWSLRGVVHTRTRDRMAPVLPFTRWNSFAPQFRPTNLSAPGSLWSPHMPRG